MKPTADGLDRFELIRRCDPGGDRPGAGICGQTGLAPAVWYLFIHKRENDEIVVQIAAVVFAGGWFGVQIKAKHRDVKIDIFGWAIRGIEFRGSFVIRHSDF